MKHKTLEQLAAESAQADNQFEIKGGIAYCTVCGKPRQTYIDFAGNKKLVWHSCACLEAKRDTADADRIEKLQWRGGVSPNCTFAKAEMSDVMEKCRRYAEHWDEVYEKGAGLLLCGDVGTGKTFAAHAIANVLLLRDIPVYITSLSKVLNLGFDKSEVLRRVKETPLVVFDDLGAERSSEFALEQVFLLVDERYRTEKPLIVTTNLTLDEIKHPKEIDRKRIYDRLLQCCAPLYFGGRSKREREAVDLAKFMQKLWE